MKEERATVPDVVDEVMADWRAEIPEAAELPGELAKRVQRLASILNEATDRALAPLGLQKAEFGVLSTLRRVGPPYRLKPNELTRALFISSGGTSNVLRRLESAGFIERGDDPTDQRSSWVRLTREGVRMAEQAVQAWAAAQTSALAPVPERAAREAANRLREVLVALGDARPQNRAPSRTRRRPDTRKVG
ncbi:MarR family winged helix-turn-helix transcriptional regulator [Pendulispora albinea]|uniref:MarR family transcriptional regulator n=1 Tax=Pendulispora albinea TaxID=2741071 RepID=A0ABZ2M4C9_9BACT